MKKIAAKISVIFIYFVFAGLLNSVGILVERSQTIYGVSKVEASFLEPFKDISIAVTAFFAGSFLPRIGYKKALLISLALSFLACLCMYGFNSFSAVRLLFLAVGISFAVIKVTVMALIGQITNTSKEHSSFMNLIESVFMLGIIIMYLVFPLFYDDKPDGWLKGFLVMSVMIALAFIFVAFSNLRLDEQETVSFKETFSEMKCQLTSRQVIFFALFAFFYVMTEQGIMSWLPTFNNDVLNLSPKLSTQVSVLLMISIALGRLLSSYAVRKIHWFMITIFCSAGAAVFIISVLPLASGIDSKEINAISDIPPVAFIFPLIGLFLAPLYPLVNSALLSNTSKKMQTGLAGILTFFSAAGGSFGSLIIGNLFDRIGGGKIFYLSLIPLSIMVFALFKIKNEVQNKN